ncbi:PAZ domain-containing protein [Endogone sp. FLAS-F59071]|nr:PAZ domain-containing protein [Endogone sp. FLAS-F59071]|eukprot:RUS12797.1 PAZ domain-containing protein [Endogone sp. FLAS-F59071]
MSAPTPASRPEESPIPLRPSLGTLGRRIRVETNFFELRLPTKPLLYQLDVKFSEPKLPLQKRHEALEQMRVMNPNLKIYYDGSSMGAINRKFENDAEMMTMEVILPSGGQDSKPIKITLKIVATLSYAELAAFLSGTQREIPTDYIKLLNMYLFHFAVHNPALATFPKSSSFFMLDGQRVKLQDRLDLLFGGFMSVRWSGVDLNMRPLNRAYVNVDTVATAFYSQGPLLERLKPLISNLNKKLSLGDIDMVNKVLKTLKIQVTYRGPKSKRYTILNISKKSAMESSFEVDGKKRTVAQHFQIAYKIQLKYPNLPCVVVAGGPTGKIDLPFEVCDIPNGE